MVALRIPIATYRLQVSREFGFEDARSVIVYLHRLGISDLYTSPIFKARQGSSHGYDVTDPSRLNPELGAEEDFKALVQELKAKNMGLLLDIVPNHMAIDSENPWWMDLLENGLCSPYAAFFDIDWHPIFDMPENKVLLPILRSPYGQELENQELTLMLEDKTGFAICYHEYKLPLDVKSCALILSHRLDTLEARLGAENSAFRQFEQLIEGMKRLPSHASSHPGNDRADYRERQAVKEELLGLVNSSSEIRSFLLENVALFNGEKGVPHSFDLLDQLLAQQAYQLVLWRTALENLNYRRFFDISHLIGIRVEEPEVFEASHALILRFAREGKVTGLRIDHIDGLNDPLEYLRRLQRRLASEVETATIPSFYVIVEKILSGDESLPGEWPVFGTTGYDFLNALNAMFVDERGLQYLKALYARLTGSQSVFDDVAYEKKKQVIEELFASEMRTLGHNLKHLAQNHRQASDLSQTELFNAFVEFTACLSVYRTYIRTARVSPEDRYYVEDAIREAQRRAPHLELRALTFLRQLLLLNFPAYLAPTQREAWLGFVKRWQQLTGAIMAKGVEDTALYTYNPLVSVNEVGGDPGKGALSIEAFHQFNLARQAHWPHTMNASSTHDTKRSEDVRARLNVLSEIPEIWEGHLSQWSKWNQAKKRKVNEDLLPDPNVELLVYQTLLGTWPLLKEEVFGFKERVRAYMIKATREAKRFTSWLSPNPEYEDALLGFLDSILEDSPNNEFLTDFLRFQRQVAYYGALNALGQVLLKIASPGVPDFYQGTELWDFSLVDPDNRRPVDFEKRRLLLDALMHQERQGQVSLIRDLLNSWEDGRVKLYLTHKALGVRKDYPDLFQKGDYVPLQVQGKQKEHVCAFGRHWGETWAMVVVPRLLAKLVAVGELPLGQPVWSQDVILLPDDSPEYWQNVFTGENLSFSATEGATLSSIFATFPLALLIGKT